MENLDEVLEQAGNCLNCRVPMCRGKGCPVGTNIPGFIQMVKENKFGEAYEILQENNILSEICSTVCPVYTQCMGSCVKGIKGEPVKISYLEKFVNEWADENGVKYIPKIKKKSTKKVAVIGAGPAGIACAAELAKNGAEVTIFEKETKCGGILEYGIPDFRLDKKSIQRVVEKLECLGTVIKTGIELGKDITIDSLKKQGYNNIFLGIRSRKTEHI